MRSAPLRTKRRILPLLKSATSRLSLSFIATMRVPPTVPLTVTVFAQAIGFSPALTLRAGAENERQPRKGEGPDEYAVCREGHMSAC